jgi:hypothetical protein
MVLIITASIYLLQQASQLAERSNMSNVIQWADAVKALEVIAEEQQAVSGMTVAEAATALKYTKAASGMYLKTVMSTAAESAVGATATEVATATATEAASTTAVNLTLIEGAGGAAEVAGIGSIALPIAACIAGAAGGYLIGKELNKNPVYSSFFDNLVYKTCDFVTGRHLADELINENNAPTVPILYDANGKTFLPSDLVSGIKSYLDSMPSSYPTESMSEVLSLYGVSTQITVVNYTNAIILNELNNPYLYLWVTNGDFYINGSNNICATDVGYLEYWNLNTKASEYFATIKANGQEYLSSAINKLYCVKTLTRNGITYLPNLTMSYVEHPTILPSCVTKYTPSTTIATSPKTDPLGNTWTRVFLPTTSPSEMPDGEAVPEVEPSTSRLTPYIAPTQPQPAEVPIVTPTTTPTNPIVIPNPEPIASTDPYPAPNPANDPSQLADPLLDPLPESIPDPVNTGFPTVPVVPSSPLPVSAKGLLHVYNPTTAQVDAFGEWLWTTFSGDIIDTISKLFNNPMDAVIGLHEIYCTPTESATDVNIRAGYLESNVPSRLVTERYIEIKCGALSIPEYWGNYLDYAPYTKSYCYLPFIGIVELNTDDIVGSGVEITYRVDVYNGSCIALITTAKPNSAESVSYQFEGNCSVSVPITSGMMTAVQNALIGVATTALSAGATAAVTVATGGVALPAAVLAGSVAAGATKQGLTSKNQVQYSGSFGSSYGAMGIKKPFLIIKRPKQKVVYGYNKNYGYPAHKMVLLSTCTGYLKAIEVNVISPTATEAEKKMIEQCLKTGVFVS